MPGSNVEYDLRIQRHQVVKVADENGWGRQASPNFDYFQRGGDYSSATEVQVFYFDNGNINSARIIDPTEHTSVAAARPNLLATVLSWLTADG